MKPSRLLAPLLLAAVTAVSALLPVSSAFAACSDCAWLYTRCMRTANTTEKAQQCEASRAECEETFCQNPLRAQGRTPVERRHLPLVDATARHVSAQPASSASL